MMATGKALGRDGRRWGEFSAGVGRSSAQCRAGKEGQLGTKSPRVRGSLGCCVLLGVRYEENLDVPVAHPCLTLSL